MIVCKKCGADNPSYDTVCHECSSPVELSDEEQSALLKEVTIHLTSRDLTAARGIYRLLGELGNLEGEREFAKMCERGIGAPKDLDTATRYFYSAAKKGDAYSAYRYSRLIARGNERLGAFWLEYSAILGCREAYSDAADYYSARYDFESAAYYLCLLSEEGESDAIVELARRYIDGWGIEASEAHAKWYMEKLTFPPIHALKLAYRLRSVKPSPAPKIPFKREEEVLRRLLATAKQLAITSAVLCLAELFYATDAPDGALELGLLTIEGEVCKKDVAQGIKYLEEACRAGCFAAARHLADIYAAGVDVREDKEMAIGYYKLAAEYGMGGELESIADIFLDGRVTPPEPRYALSLYERGESHGHEGCKKKAENIKKSREEKYQAARKAEEKSPKEAAELYKKAVDMGYIPAHKKLARFYMLGIEVKQNRKTAYQHYKAAVEGGDRSALTELGICYARGLGTRFDFSMAARTLSLAVTDGSKEAELELYRIYENKRRHLLRALYSQAMRLMYLQKTDEAIRLLKLAAREGDAASTYTLGCLFEFGVGVNQSRSEALVLYERARKSGYTDKMQRTKRQILKMTQKPHQTVKA